ncbi:hypothetical protein QTO30_21190 [Yoonia sp. GPGPB17]|uniref:hypothetical protein n=1 Tax=Yoonia sp. GPGPB17 TaxID=3026147 RepID=UPI0030BBB120
MVERTYGSFQDVEGMHGYTRDDIAEMSKDQKIRMMVSWFHAHFEDPAHRTPYESREGGYQWIWGGPHEANDEVQDEFGEVVEYEIMKEAIDEIESDGLLEWAPREQPGDYDDDGVLNGEIVDGDEEWPPIIVTSQSPISEPAARQDVAARLDELEALIQPLVSPQGMMGHNHPPEPLEVEHPCSREEWLALNEAVAAIREQTKAQEPDDAIVAEKTLTLGAVASKLAGWLKVRAEKGIDAALVACGTAAGASVVVNIQSIVDALGRTVQSVSTWIESFPWPF